MLEVSKIEVLELISEYIGVEDIIELIVVWENVVVVGDWVLIVSVINLIDDIVFVFMINGENVLEFVIIFLIFYVFGIFDYINEFILEVLILIVKVNILVGEYIGIVIYIVVDLI